MSWPDTVEDVLGGDQAVILAYVTPAKGVVLAPVTNFGVQDRAAVTVTPNSSIGAWKKLDRIRRNPRVALAFHTREHGFSERPEYVLVQGTATLTPPHPDYPSTIRESWERFAVSRDVGRLWERWMRVYHTRVGIEIRAERVVVWPDLACEGALEVHGAPLPADPPEPQRPPARGTAPRLNHVRAAHNVARLPNRLVGWVGADGFPFVVPVGIDGTEERGIVLQAPAGLVPAGGRRAGLTAHAFTRYVLGQHQRVNTGWLEATADELVYAPHTQAAYRFPPSVPLYRLVVGAATRRRFRQARRDGVAHSVPGRGALSARKGV